VPRRAVGERDVAVGGDAGDRGREADLRPDVDGPVEQQARQLRAGHAHGGREVVAAGAGVGELGDDGAVGRAQPEDVERVAVRQDPVEHPQVAQDPQGVALERDARAGGGDVGLDLDEVDGDAGLGEQDRGGTAGGPTTDDQDGLHCGHGGAPT
jgi:hypothetical protein